MNQENYSNAIPSFLNESIRKKTMDVPIEASYSSSWERDREKFRKSFVFSSREELKSFCNYILDYEINSGVLFDIVIHSKKNRVDLSMSKLQTGSKSKKTLSKIDAISRDIKESYRSYE